MARLPEVCEPGDEVTLLAVAKPAARQQVGSRPLRAATSFADASGTARMTPGRDTPVFETREQAYERQMAALSSYLNRNADALQSQGFRVYIRPVVATDPAQSIIEYARTHRPDVIVMVRRTLDPRRWIFGSVSSAVVRAKAAPVLLLEAGNRRARTTP
jgi:nucleotide-binding universal stress UspA family protein